MPRIAPDRPPLLRLLLAGVLLSGAVPLSACGTPPELRDRPGSLVPTYQVSPSAASSNPATTPPLQPSVGNVPPPPTPVDQSVGPCRSGPDAGQVLALLRRTDGLLPRGVRAKVTRGPLCADRWQYAVVDVTGHEALEVVSQGRPGSLTLVTAGTDVCTIEVRTLAPSGVRALACESAAGSGPGA